MALLDTVKQVMKGRSALLERGIDKAVERVGHYSEALKDGAVTVKVKARSLDTDRGSIGGADASPRAMRLLL